MERSFFGKEIPWGSCFRTNHCSGGSQQKVGRGSLWFPRLCIWAETRQRFMHILIECKWASRKDSGIWHEVLSTERVWVYFLNPIKVPVRGVGVGAVLGAPGNEFRVCLPVGWRAKSFAVWPPHQGGFWRCEHSFRVPRCRCLFSPTPLAESRALNQGPHQNRLELPPTLCRPRLAPGLWFCRSGRAFPTDAHAAGPRTKLGDPRLSASIRFSGRPPPPPPASSHCS